MDLDKLKYDFKLSKFWLMIKENILVEDRVLLE